jgi:hypothetical protein
MKVRIGLIGALMLLGTPAGADPDASATALASSQAAVGAFSEMLSRSTVENGFPGMADPTAAAILNAAWNLGALKIANPAEAKDLQDLDKICMNGMIIWKSYIFDRIDGLEDLDTKILKRIVQYQAEIGPGMAFSIRCAAAFIDAYEAAAPEVAVDQRGTYQFWIEKEKGWITSSFGVVCAGVFAADNSRPLSDALHAVLPGLVAPDRQTLDRDALRKSAHDAVAGTPVMPGAKGLKSCNDLETLLAPGPSGEAR